MTRTITTTLDNIIDLINCSQEYGFCKGVLMDAFANLTKWVTDEEIIEYAEWYLSPAAFMQGYDQEDYVSAIETITEWRNKYCENWKR